MTVAGLTHHGCVFHPIYACTVQFITGEGYLSAFLFFKTILLQGTPIKTICLPGLISGKVYQIGKALSCSWGERVMKGGGDRYGYKTTMHASKPGFGLNHMVEGG